MSALSSLKYLDLSNNQLTGRLPANLSQTLTTISLAYNDLEGELPAIYYELRGLEILFLQNNSLDGTVTSEKFEHDAFTKEDSVFIMDFQNNNFTGFTAGSLLDLTNITLQLTGNPVCNGSLAPLKHCANFNDSVIIPTTPLVISITCSASSCDLSRNQELNFGLLAFNSCVCAYPLTAYYRLKSPSFAIYEPYKPLFEAYLANSTNLSNYQINASVFRWEPGPRLNVNLKLFPDRNTSEFSGTIVTRLYNQFATWQFPESRIFGPYEMIAFDLKFPYTSSETSPGSKSGLSGGVMAGIVIGAAVFTALVVAALMLLLGRHKYRHAPPGKRPAHEHIKVAGVKDFAFKELRQVTNNFDNSRQIGQGGYGRVYKAELPDGMEVAIKRAQEGSLQGGKEFLTELELLSRVHHRNLVSLVGYCDDEGEQMLVYEYMANGSLQDHLNSDSKVPLNFATRVQIALGAVKGISSRH